MKRNLGNFPPVGGEKKAKLTPLESEDPEVLQYLANMGQFAEGPDSAASLSTGNVQSGYSDTAWQSEPYYGQSVVQQPYYPSNTDVSEFGRQKEAFEKLITPLGQGNVKQIPFPFALLNPETTEMARKILKEYEEFQGSNKERKNFSATALTYPNNDFPPIVAAAHSGASPFQVEEDRSADAERLATMNALATHLTNLGKSGSIKSLKNLVDRSNNSTELYENQLDYLKKHLSGNQAPALKNLSLIDYCSNQQGTGCNNIFGGSEGLAGNFYYSTPYRGVDQGMRINDVGQQVAAAQALNNRLTATGHGQLAPAWGAYPYNYNTNQYLSHLKTDEQNVLNPLVSTTFSEDMMNLYGPHNLRQGRQQGNRVLLSEGKNSASFPFNLNQYLDELGNKANFPGHYIRRSTADPTLYSLNIPSTTTTTGSQGNQPYARGGSVFKKMPISPTKLLSLYQPFPQSSRYAKGGHVSTLNKMLQRSHENTRQFVQLMNLLQTVQARKNGYF